MAKKPMNGFYKNKITANMNKTPTIFIYVKSYIKNKDSSFTVRKAKRDAGPQHKGDGKFRRPYR
jgi:hypothetical protein